MIVLLLLAIVPNTPVIEETCGRLEYNHYYDHQGNKVFVQLIGWDWYEEDAEWHCRFYLLANDPYLRPSKDPQGGWAVTFYDNHGRFIRIEAASFDESWTQYDPEVEDRQHLPKEHRRELVTLNPQRSN